MRLHGKTVWLTGASSGIGEALVPALLARGASTLILSARRRSELERVARGDPKVRVEPLDLADTPALAPRARAVLEAHGPVDVLIHNAGISQRSRAIDTSLEVDERLMRVNYLGPVALTKALLPSLVSRRGQIVAVSSLVGVFGTPLRSGYSASKHALHGFFDSLRAEHRADGLEVTLVCPGFIATDISKNALTGDGSPLGTMDVKTGAGMAPAALAEAMVRAIERGREEVYLGGGEVNAVYLKRLAPGLFSRLIARAKVT